MLYLVLPSGKLQWTDILGQSVLDSAQEQGKDLGVLDWWKDAERTATPLDIRVALRYGIASQKGIVVYAGNVVVARRPDELRATFAESAASRAALEPQLARLDPLMGEGATVSRHALDARVDESLANSLHDAEEDASAVLTGQDPEARLVDHWGALGGFLPDPL